MRCSGRMRRCGRVPLPGLFQLDLWNQEFAGRVRLQNIDSRDLGWKISGMSGLRRLKKQIPSGVTTRRATTRPKAKGCAVSAAFSDLYVSILAN
jgi:hypothetical protein